MLKATYWRGYGVSEEVISAVTADGASTLPTSKIIQLPAKYFTFMYHVKGARSFKVKCMLYHQRKTTYASNGQPKYLSISNNSLYNAKRHMKSKHSASLADYLKLWKEKGETESQANAVTEKGNNVVRSQLDQHMGSSVSQFKQIKTQIELDEAIL
ncbi:hypothetical protein OUZ56_021685 [Daphnia magna]|uniref:Uncharacterized protein n=1 Tax=Daphnia magna TaxID=35525 RepID=A0ABR0AU72_9CRUS|nr:hypothetical protein OUZ56_021685 [Daphnia magna]